jgi:hypothetical protein
MSSSPNRILLLCALLLLAGCAEFVPPTATPVTPMMQRTPAAPQTRQAEPAPTQLSPQETPAAGSGIIALLPTPAPNAAGAAIRRTATVRAPSAELRSAPQADAQLLGSLLRGASVQVMEYSPDRRWIRVCCPLDATGAVWLRTEAVTIRITAPSTQAGVPTLTPTPEPEPTPVELAGVVNGARVNVRGGPGTTYPVTGQATQGQTLQIIGRSDNNEWLHICCPSPAHATGWISAAFVDLAEQELLTLLPAVEAPPAPVSGGGGRGRGPRSAAELASAPAVGLPGPGSFSPPTGADPLTGLPGDASLRPVVVCVNNDYAARPQRGFSEAAVVYEYLMEGYGITRFSAIYTGGSAPQIGPVRSARLINYYMTALYDAGLVCSGASDPVRYNLKHDAPFPYLDIDLDDPSNSRYSVSIGSDYRTRLRTDSTSLRRWLNDWAMAQSPRIRGFTFGPLPGDGGAPATNITIPYPRGAGSHVTYRYDSSSGRYLRSMGGAAHIDGNSGSQLAVENVIVQVVPHEATQIVEDSLGSTSIRLNLFGSHRAIVFRDGVAFAGTWRSDSRGDTPRFFDSSGVEISLKAGKSFISVVPPDYNVTYQ